MISILPIIIIALILAFLATLYFIFLDIRKKSSLQRALNMSLFLIRLPKESGEGKQEKDLISIGEQLLAGFSNIKAEGFNSTLYGAPHLSLEIAVQNVGEETRFYVSTPRSYEALVEKQIHGYYPNAEVQRVRDYNIFNPIGASAASTLALTRNSMLPVQTYQSLPTDPLNSILTSMSKLESRGEGAAIQILARPVSVNRENVTKVVQGIQAGYSFQEALKRTGASKKEGEEEEQRPPATPADTEVAKSIQEKASKQNFSVNVRLVSSAENQSRADQIISELEGSFSQFSAPNMNSFAVNRMSGSGLEKLYYNFSFRIFDNKRSMRLSSEELTSLYHLPTPFTVAPKLETLRARSAEPPANLPSEGVILGSNIYRGDEVQIRLAENDRRRHLYAIGQTGTGKSTLLKNMITQDLESGRGLCVVDPHGDLAEYVLSVIPEGRKEDVVYFSPGDTQKPLGMNMLEFDLDKPEQKTFITNELLEILKSIYPDVGEAFGPMFEQYFKNAVLLLLDDSATEIPTLADIPRVLSDTEYRKDKLSRETNQLVKNFWEQEAEKAGGEGSLANITPYITSKLNPFLSNDYLRPIIGQQKSAFNFREVMDSGKILVVNLSKGTIGDANANLLGTMAVSKLLMASLSRVDLDEDQRNDFYLYIDEFQNFTTDSISTILSEARKYRLDLIIAHQFIHQLKDSIREAVFGNVGSMVAFRIGADDAEFMKNQFEPVFTVNDLMNIDNFNAHAKLLINNQTTNPFNVKINKEKDGSPEMKNAVKELAINKYGRDRGEVEQEVSSRLQF